MESTTVHKLYRFILPFSRLDLAQLVRTPVVLHWHLVSKFPADVHIAEAVHVQAPSFILPPTDF